MKNRTKLFHDTLTAIIYEIFSPEMAEYIDDNLACLSKWQIGESVKGALVSLEKKRDWFYQLAEYENIDLELQEAEDEDEKERIMEESYQYIAEHIDNALLELEGVGREGSLIIVHEMELDIDKCEDELIAGTVPFVSYAHFRDYLQEYMEWEDDLEGKWLLIEKYKKAEDKQLKHSYSYIFYQGEAVFYRNELEDDESWTNPDLNLPIFGYPGEIYSTDGRPFQMPKRFLMLEKNDNHDSCAVQVLLVEDGKVRSTALKHGTMYYNKWSKASLSPLYNLQTFKKRLPEKENALYTAQGFMNGCEAAGRLLGYMTNIPIKEYTEELFGGHSKIGG